MKKYRNRLKFLSGFDVKAFLTITVFILTACYEGDKVQEFFTNDELKCPCCHAVSMDDDFIYRLNMVRYSCGFPLKINSGFRCHKHNLEVGGSPISYHLLGRAVDISREHMNSFMLRRLVYEALHHGLTVGMAKNFVHLDNRKVPIFYTYPDKDH